MTQISRDTLLHLARLSKLELDEPEIDSLQKDISDILDYIEQLKQLDTEGIEPTYQVSGLKNIWRDDEVSDYGLNRDDLLKLSQETQDNHVKVPKVL